MRDATTDSYSTTHCPQTPRTSPFTRDVILNNNRELELEVCLLLLRELLIVEAIGIGKSVY